MKVIIVGATGLIGREVVKALRPAHEIVEVSHRDGQVRVDITSKESIREMYEQIGAFDALVSAAGSARFGRIEDLTDDDFMVGLKDELMGQMNLVRVGRHFARDGGSFTLTSGVLSQRPIPGSAAISMVNAALEGFVRAAALELKRGKRVNVVSPIFANETLAALGMKGIEGMPAANFAPAYKESVESQRNGEVLDVRAFAN